jgi:hypothetical protein
MRNNDEKKGILVATAQQAWNELKIRHLEHLLVGKTRTI